MKLFQQLMLAPAALGLVAPMGAMAGELNFGGVSKYASTDEQVTSISQFSDVYPTDWAYQALANLIERYGCVAGYPNGTFQGNRALSRYEAAALLNACLDRVTEITDEVRRLMKAFEKELAVVKARVDGLEAAVGELEATQFSTTTKLKGKVRFIMGDAYRGDGWCALASSRACSKQRLFMATALTTAQLVVIKTARLMALKTASPKARLTGTTATPLITVTMALKLLTAVCSPQFRTRCLNPNLSASCCSPVGFQHHLDWYYPRLLTSALDNGTGLHNYNAILGWNSATGATPVVATATIIIPSNGTRWLRLQVLLVL